MKLIGSILIYAGTAIGAGMLALPLATAHIGFPFSLILFLSWWVVMTFTAFMLLEVNLCFQEGASFSSMSVGTLGRTWQTITWFCFLLLLYSLIAGYVAEGGNLLQTTTLNFFKIDIPSWGSTFIYTSVLAVFVFFGKAKVDYINRLFMSLQIVIFFIVFFMLIKYIDISNLVGSKQHLPFIMPAVPVIMVCFGSHFVIPSLRGYLNSDEKKLKIVILIGSLIPLFIYICWETVSLGVLPLSGDNSFQHIFSEKGSVAEMMSVMKNIIESPTINYYTNIFMHMALATSFLGASLSLFDFVMDGFSLDFRNWSNRILVTITIYAIPVVFALYYPKGFILALRYASIFGAILVILLPSFMVLKLQKTERFRNSFYTKWHNFIIYLSITSGLAVILIAILINLNLMIER